MLHGKLKLVNMSNTKFYKKCVPEIAGARDAGHQRVGGDNARYYKSVTGGRRGNASALTWSDPVLEEKCSRPFLNLALLFPDSEEVMLHRITQSATRKSTRELFREGFDTTWFAADVLEKVRELHMNWCPCERPRASQSRLQTLPPLPPPSVPSATPRLDMDEGELQQAPQQTQPQPQQQQPTQQPTQQQPTGAAAPAKRRAKKRTKLLITLSEIEVQQFMERMQCKARWLLEMCKWIAGERAERLEAIKQWAQFNASAELVITVFLAMEADARMRAAARTPAAAPAGPSGHGSTGLRAATAMATWRRISGEPAMQVYGCGSGRAGDFRSPSARKRPALPAPPRCPLPAALVVFTTTTSPQLPPFPLPPLAANGLRNP